MNIYKFDPSTLKGPLTVIYDSHNKRWDEEVHFIESRDSTNKLIFVDAAEAGAKLGDGVTADALKTHIFVRDAAGKVVSDLDAVYAAHHAIGLGPYFRFGRVPGFQSEGTGIQPAKKAA